MLNFLFETFISKTPDAVLLAKRPLHEVLDDEAIMYIYTYKHGNKHCYMLRFRNTMVTNPLMFPCPISHSMIPLFCYEWFLEYETLSGVKEMVENDDEFYHSPYHLNIWRFARKWERRFGYGGEQFRKQQKEKAFSLLSSLQESASSEELLEIKQNLEGFIDGISTI